MKLVAEYESDSSGEEEQEAEVQESTSQNNADNVSTQKDDDEDDDEDEDEDDLEDVGIDGSGLPFTLFESSEKHEKSVSAIDVDSSGSRMLTGSHDFTVKLWDFNSMDTGFSPFRSFTPWEGCSIREAKFSITGNRILLCSSSAAAKLYDRDGLFLQEYAKGDPYIRDRRHTHGHIMSITGCDWHPTDGNLFVTSSMDGTVRVWATPRHRRCNETIVLKSKLAKVKAAVTTVKYSHDHIATACLDGSIRLYNLNGPYVRPVLECSKAHIPESEITSLAVSASGRMLLSRAMDDTMKLWDLRMFGGKATPVHLFENLPTLYPETRCIFSPDDLHVLTGTSSSTSTTASITSSSLNGSLRGFSVASGEASVTEEIEGSGLLGIFWDKRLNQVFCGLTNGSVRFYYDTVLSKRGILSALEKRGSVKPAFSIVDAHQSIITPHSLPLFRNNAPKSTKRKLIKERKDPIKSKQPELPLSGQGKGGRISESHTQHVMLSLNKNTMRDEDPREALLKYAKEAEENPTFIGHVYKKTQPKTIFQEGEFEEYQVKRRK